MLLVALTMIFLMLVMSQTTKSRSDDFETVEGYIMSIELVERDRVGNYTVHLRTSDGRDLDVTCMRRLCDGFNEGDKIKADFDTINNQLTRPIRRIA